MKTAAVVCDNHKIPTFRKALEGSDFSYTEKGHFTPETFVFHVKYNPVHMNRLKKLIKKANHDSKHSN